MDSNTVSRVMRECRNFFESGYLKTRFVISAGVISPSALFPPGSYIAVMDSAFHNGVYLIQEGGVMAGVPAGVFDETFDGKVWFLRPPDAFLQLCEEIDQFIAKTPKGAYQSESFGDYSYSLASGKSGGVLSWREKFAGELNEYRHMFTEVKV